MGIPCRLSGAQVGGREDAAGPLITVIIYTGGSVVGSMASTIRYRCYFHCRRSLFSRETRTR